MEKTRRIDLKKVKLYDEIFCENNRFRSVEMIDHLGGGRFKFSFTDGRWAEYAPGKKAIVKVENA